MSHLTRHGTLDHAVLQDFSTREERTQKRPFHDDQLAEEFNGFVNTLATFGRFVELDNYFVRDALPLGAAPIAAGGN